MSVMKKWNYGQSVARVQGMVLSWKNLTIDLLSELYVAREELSWVGRPETGTNGPINSWAGYCGDVGLSKRTVNRWLERFDPVGKKILAPVPDLYPLPPPSPAATEVAVPLKKAEVVSPPHDDDEVGEEERGPRERKLERSELRALEAMLFPEMSISQLERIRSEDPMRTAALEKVQEWIKRNL